MISVVHLLVAILVILVLLAVWGLLMFHNLKRWLDAHSVQIQAISHTVGAPIAKEIIALGGSTTSGPSPVR